MPADPNIYANFLQQPRSAVDYANDFAKADATRNQNALQALSLQQAADVQTQRNTLRQAVQSGQIDLSNPAGVSSALTMAPDVAPALVKTIQDGATGAAKAQADLGAAAASRASAGKMDQETLTAQRQQHFSDLATVNTPEDALAWGADGVRLGIISPDKFPAAVQALQQAAQTPQGFAQWKLQAQTNALTAADQLKQQTATPTEVKLGNVTKFIDMNPHSTTFGKEVAPPQQMGISPDAQLQANTSTANNRAGIAKDLTIAGMNQDGSVSPNIESEAQMIAAGKMPPPSGMAATRPAAAALMARVSQINPTYDATTYGAKAAAAKAFTSGQQGNALRSISTANEHLGQLDALGDALNNGNIPIINSIANAYGVQTGAAPAQVFNAVKGVVAQEVVKAIVAGGGSAGERDEAAHAFSSASSPAQLKQTIAAYRAVMGAQQSNLMDQRRAAGLPDSTLPGYGGAGGAAPAGAFKITHVDGQPQ